MTGIADTKTFLQIFVERGDWDAANSIIMQDMQEVFERNSSGKTVLHAAVIAGRERIVEKLVNTDYGEQLVSIQDNNGYTALAYVALLNGSTRMAKCMVDKNPELLTTKTKDDEIPLLLASARGHKELTRFLFSRTSAVHGFFFSLSLNCISTKIFDVALHLCYSRTEPPPGVPLLLALANMPSVFPSGCRLHWWQKPIYGILKPQYRSLSDRRLVTIQSPAERDIQAELRRLSRVNVPLGYKIRFTLQYFIYKWLHGARVGAGSILLKLPVIKEVYDTKVEHYLVLQILELPHRVADINDFNEQQNRKADAVLLAAKNGIVEFIKTISRTYPKLLWAIDSGRRGVFTNAILNRQEKLFKFLHEEAEAQMRRISPHQDAFGNNMLHQAAELGPSSGLDSKFGAALRMQREIQWFKMAEEIVHPICKEATNGKGQKPHEVFTESHKVLVEAGEKWAKDTAQSFTIVCTLIITITFAAAFAVPGGNNQDGFPMFLKKTLFEVFIMADAVSLVTSSSSVLLSIVFLTSRQTEQDFLTRLPFMLMLNLLFLFMSVVAMNVAFCAGIAIMLEGYRNLVIAAISLASLPVILFVRTEFPLFFKIAMSTIELEWFTYILLLPYRVVILILAFLRYLTKMIRACPNFCSRGANFLLAKCCK